MQFSFDEKRSHVPEEFLRRNGHLVSHRITDLARRQEKKEYRDAADFSKLPFDAGLLRAAEEAAARLRSPRLKYIFLLGIGGSNLGAKAVYDAFFGFADAVTPARSPKMIFIDGIHAAFLEHLENFVRKEIRDPEEFAVVLATRSGTTAETIANFEMFFGMLRAAVDKNAADRVIMITGENSPLKTHAAAKNIHVLTTPEPVGGRFSFFTPVGLVPLHLLGLDVNALIGGAAAMHARCLSTDALHNPAIASAVTTYFHIREGKTVLNSFFFDPQLESLGKWYRQLLAESLGKEKDLSGETVNAGILPVVSIGSADLHSVAQLYFGGPKNIFTSFIKTRATSPVPAAPLSSFFPGLVPHIEGKSAADIMNAIYGGTTAAYASNGLPFVEISLEDVSPHSLGQFFQFKMMEVVLLGDLLKVNIFDQPSVELYKTETRKRLASNEI